MITGAGTIALMVPHINRLPVALMALALLFYGLVTVLTSWFDNDAARIAAAVVVAVLGFWSGVSMAHWPTARTASRAEHATQILHRRASESRGDQGRDA